MNQKPVVGVLTTFSDFNPSYSLCSVVESQLVSLVKHGYKTVLFVLPSFHDDSRVPVGVEVRKVVPQFKLVDYSDHREPEPGLNEQADEFVKVLNEHASDINVMIEHDLIFQGWFLPYCVGIHKHAIFGTIKWFHWIHSVPNLPPANLNYPHNLRYSLPRNSKLVYLNNHGIIRAAESYQSFPKDVRVVPNPVDPRLFLNLHPLVSSLIDRYGLLDADFVQTYPLSTPRMISGKGLEAVIDVFGKLKENGKTVRLIVCNAHANGEAEKNLIKETQEYGLEAGLNQIELIYTSLENPPSYELGVPREVVSQLFQLSNLFVFPSSSENCSLVLLEAMLSKNLLILNENVPPMREVAKENALYFKFGSLDDHVAYDDKPRFYNDVAKIIISEMGQNKAIKASTETKKKFNYDYIFRNYLEPLFYEQ